jgi:hypothetical protein
MNDVVAIVGMVAVGNNDDDDDDDDNDNDSTTTTRPRVVRTYVHVYCTYNVYLTHTCCSTHSLLTAGKTRNTRLTVDWLFVFVVIVAKSSQVNAALPALDIQPPLSTSCSHIHSRHGHKLCPSRGRWWGKCVSARGCQYRRRRRRRNCRYRRCPW